MFPSLLLLAVFLFFYRLGVPGLMDPDEGRYAEIAREMLASGDFITPQLNGLPYLEKPPLVYWLTALSLACLGATEWSARLVAALSALGGVWAVFWLANRLWDTPTALWSGLVTVTSSGYFIMGRILTLDMALTCCLTWGVALAYVSWREANRRLLCWAYGVIGLGVLTKGLVALVLPGLIFVTWLTWERRWRQWQYFWHAGGALLLVLLVLPWHLLVAWQNPEFWRFFFWEEHIQRFLTPRIHAGQPVYFYVGVVLAGLLPWTFLLPWAWRVAAAGDPAAANDRRFLLIWFGVIFVFFSLSRAKLWPYLLPGLPPLALLVGLALAKTAGADLGQSRVWRFSLGAWLGFALLLLAALAVLWQSFPATWQRLAFLAPQLLWGNIFLTLPPLLLLSGWPRAPWPGVIILVGALGLMFGVISGIERLAEQRSPRPLALIIKQTRQADAVILGYQAYSQALSFYVGQPLYVYGLKGELAFGLRQRPDTPFFFQDLPQVLAFLQQQPEFYVIITVENFKIFRSVYPHPVQVLATWQKYLLLRQP